MGRVYNSSETDDYLIRIPLRMLQRTEPDGQAWPVAFEWEDDDGAVTRVKINRVVSCVPMAEQRSGTVGDRYECEIEGATEYLFYAKLQPRKWFRVIPVSREEYNAYYKLPGERRNSK
jgi:hypothetical protein